MYSRVVDMENKKNLMWITLITLVIVVGGYVFVFYNKTKTRESIISFNDYIYKYTAEQKPTYTDYKISSGSKKDEFYDTMEKKSYYIVKVYKDDMNYDIYYVSKDFKTTCFVASLSGIYCDSEELLQKIMYIYAKDFIISQDISEYNQYLNELDSNVIFDMRYNYKHIGDEFIEIYYDEYQKVDDETSVSMFKKRHITYKVDLKNKTFIKE
jgi:hypothetical protein